MLDLTLLSEDQVFGDNQLDILKKYGRSCIVTDFAILTEIIKQNLYGKWWTKTPGKNGDISFVNELGDNDFSFVDGYLVGIRPTFAYSSIKSNFSNEERKVFGIKEIEYGEYPRWAVDKEKSIILEELYNDGNISETGKKYTTFFHDIDYDEDEVVKIVLRKKTHTEYEYDGKKYIRFVVDLDLDGAVFTDGRTIKNNEPYWIKVEPIKWLVDEKNDVALSKYIIVSGIPFDDKFIYRGDFKNTFIKKFMDKYLAKDIECSIIKDKLIKNIENKSYDFDSIFEDAIKKMNDINESEKPKIMTLK